MTAIIGIGMMCIIVIPAHAKVENGQKSNVQDIKEGFKYLKDHAFIKQLLIYLFVVMILISPAAFLTPLMVSRSFGPEVWRLTASEMTFSAGALVGGVLIASWGGFKSRMHTNILACAFYGLLMVGLGVAPMFAVYLLFNLLIGITMPCFNAPLTVLLQQNVDPDMQGRVFSLVQVTNSCALPLGMVLFGPLADSVQVETILIFAGIAVIMCALYAVIKLLALAKDYD